MNAFTQIICNAVSHAEVDRRTIRTVGGEAITDEQRRQAVGVFIRYLLYEVLMNHPMPEFAASTIIEAFENHVDWDWVGKFLITEVELN